MKVCVYGAGAVGGLIAAQLARSGVPVSVVARGATLSALKRNGLMLDISGKLKTAQVQATDDCQALGVQDLVVMAVKAPSLEAASAQVKPLIGPNTAVLTAMNGVPWWFFHRFGGMYEGMQISAADPSGRIAAAISPEHVVGCVVRIACSAVEPGFIRHSGGMQLIVGEPDGTGSARLHAISELLSAAGFDVVVSPSIQRDVWYKLWGNMTLNPISALTGATSDKVLEDPLVSRFSLDVMREAADIGARIGCPISESGEARNAETRAVPPFKTSMLQDVEAGKPVEIDALLSTVREIGEKVGVPTPNINILLGLARLHARTRGLYPPERVVG